MAQNVNCDSCDAIIPNGEMTYISTQLHHATQFELCKVCSAPLYALEEVQTAMSCRKAASLPQVPVPVPMEE